jgi:hypothetical protein
MESENQSTTPNTNFTETQSELLGALRARYQLDQGLFTGRELSHLRFMRWLQEKQIVAEDADEWPCSQTPMQPDGPDVGGIPRCAA